MTPHEAIAVPCVILLGFSGSLAVCTAALGIRFPVFEIVERGHFSVDRARFHRREGTRKNTKITQIWKALKTQLRFRLCLRVAAYKVGLP
jgi:hypothetical protein